MDDETPLAPADRLFWAITDRFPTRPMICALYLELAGPPDRRRLEERIAAAAAAHPRLAAALVADRSGPRWRPLGAPTLAETVDAAVDHRERLARLMPRAGDPLAEGGHAWSIELLADRHGDEARTHGLLIRWHHALTDAEGMLDLLSALTDAGADDAASRASGDRKPTVADAAKPGPLARLRQATRRLRGRARPGAQVGGLAVEYRELALLDAERVAAAARGLGVTPHDVLVGVVARALHRLDLEGGAPTRIHAPLSARPVDGALRLGNLGYPLHVVVDRASPDLASALRELGAANAAALARAAAPPPWLQRLVLRLPRRALERALAAAPPFVANYLPWSDAPRSLAGATITALHGFPPLLPFRGCTLAMIGYHRQLRLLLAVDPTIHRDVDAIAAAINAEFAALDAISAPSS
ncbi:MAG: DUF1298 domain-containing protein [Myxococcales bacterium]|nr:DUF1298 domain-containing protein [Myxococcales bacterium]MCB9706176.1 DUF1298 domain-containing protein [Myxococcales bacterium]